MNNSNNPGQSKYDPASAVYIPINEASLLKNLVENWRIVIADSGQL